ncbi:hypothetical protein C6P46_006488 [Rhodotorula mucilaginosa]|uniref:Major facilitator superfamily (MFS) profile domain-containing protein n=1 Tax=Rhodotorula mucilaginosa TaxID=5537 RepID=A0A9P7B461_RHOMI|nr:hypothetical protein C6P46_006488 [Rhodotorula mucilaginosa]
MSLSLDVPDEKKVDTLGETAFLETVQREGTDAENLAAEARAATEAEHKLTLLQGLKRYPKAVAWSLLISTCIIMTGFDVVLLGSFYGLPRFNERYGTRLADGTYTITTAWQAGLSNGGKIGEIIGLTLNGYAMERFGCRKTSITALTALIGFIALSVFAKNIEMLLVGQIFCGCCFGVFETLTVTYAAELAPVTLRPYLTAYVNLCWVIGQIIGSGTLRGVLHLNGDWAYRLPFALQWIWPVPLIAGIMFAPESPWWLVRKGREDEARRTVARLFSGATDEELDNTVAMMKHTNEFEKSVSAGTSYKDCFRGVDRRRTEIACGVWMIQNLCGSAFMGYSTFFLQQAGVPVSASFDLSIGQYGLGMFGTISSWFLMSRIGRRKLYGYGLVVLTILLLIIGGMGSVPRSNKGASYGVGALLLVYTAVYDATVGPVCYTLVSEIPSTRLRAKTVVLSRIAYNLIAIINATIMPYFLNTESLNWGAKTGYFWGGLCACCAVWTYFRCPEPRGRTYGELDVLFANRVSARKFEKTEADQFAGHGGTVIEKTE